MSSIKIKRTKITVTIFEPVEDGDSPFGDGAHDAIVDFLTDQYGTTPVTFLIDKDESDVIIDQVKWETELDKQIDVQGSSVEELEAYVKDE